VVYFELPPGAHCGRHTDSAEEILLIMDGEAEIDVGDETGRLHAGGLALAPAMEPHDVRNVGETTLKVLGFFSSATLVSEHDDVIHPFGTDLLVIGAPEREPAAA
jgi:quercetin dioxygenase-like cupin family protein